MRKILVLIFSAIIFVVGCSDGVLYEDESRFKVYDKNDTYYIDADSLGLEFNYPKNYHIVFDGNEDFIEDSPEGYSSWLISIRNSSKTTEVFADFANKKEFTLNATEVGDSIVKVYNSITEEGYYETISKYFEGEGAELKELSKIEVEGISFFKNFAIQSDDDGDLYIIEIHLFEGSHMYTFTIATPHANVVEEVYEDIESVIIPSLKFK